MRTFASRYQRPAHPLPLPWHKRSLNFVKEWGGIATVIIAILYTFPFQVIDRVVNAQQHKISAARQALADASALRAEKIQALQKSQDPAYQMQINGAYDIRMYNLIANNIDLFQEVKDHLRPSELYMAGSSITLFAYNPKAAISFYNLAIEKSTPGGSDDVIATASREKGWSLFAMGDIEGARESYLIGLKALLTPNPPNRFQFAMFLSELTISELSMGDWKCGMELRDRVTPFMRETAALDANMSGYFALYTQGTSSAVKKDVQSENGCPYRLPKTVWKL